jgi:hypothetical protein
VLRLLECRELAEQQVASLCRQARFTQPVERERLGDTAGTRPGEDQPEPEVPIGRPADRFVEAAVLQEAFTADCGQPEDEVALDDRATSTRPRSRRRRCMRRRSPRTWAPAPARCELPAERETRPPLRPARRGVAYRRGIERPSRECRLHASARAAVRGAITAAAAAIRDRMATPGLRAAASARLLASRVRSRSAASASVSTSAALCLLRERVSAARSVGPSAYERPARSRKATRSFNVRTRSAVRL